MDNRDQKIIQLEAEIANLHAIFDEQIMIRTLELQQARDQAIEESKAKSQFLANISHEMRTPLNGLVNFAEMLEKTPLTDKQKYYLEFIKNSGTNLTAIVSDILDFSQSTSGKLRLHPSYVETHEVFKSAIKAFESLAQKKGLSLKAQISDGMPRRIIQDNMRLKQLMNHLVGNALKFTYQGEVSVYFLYHPEQKYHFEFTVVDTGIGIPENKIPEIFNPFTQLDNSDTRCYGGTGLGLSLVQEIVKQMNGKIEVTSEPRQGSTFQALWNCEIAAEEPVKTTTPYFAKKILLVEDMQLNREIVKTYLEIEGCEVLEAENGAEAVDLIQKTYNSHGHFDLILMDCQMPVMDGFEASLEIEKFLGLKHPPIVALTASALSETRERCMNAGMIDFLTKPIVWEELKKVMTTRY